MRSDICILLSSINGRGWRMCPAESTRIIVNLSGLVLKSMHLWIQVSGHQHGIDSPPWSALILTRLSCSVWSVFFFSVCLSLLGWRRKQRCQNYVRQLRSMSVPEPAQPVFIENRDIEGSASSSLEVQDLERAGGRGNEKERKSYPFSCRSPSNRSAARKCTVMPSGIPME